jgi:hypothetical protein
VFHIVIDINKQSRQKKWRLKPLNGAYVQYDSVARSLSLILDIMVEMKQDQQS